MEDNSWKIQFEKTLPLLDNVELYIKKTNEAFQTQTSSPKLSSKPKNIYNSCHFNAFMELFYHSFIGMVENRVLTLRRRWNDNFNQDEIRFIDNYKKDIHPEINQYLDHAVKNPNISKVEQQQLVKEVLCYVLLHRVVSDGSVDNLLMVKARFFFAVVTKTYKLLGDAKAALIDWIDVFESLFSYKFTNSQEAVRENSLLFIKQRSFIQPTSLFEMEARNITSVNYFLAFQFESNVASNKLQFNTQTLANENMVPHAILIMRENHAIAAFNFDEAKKQWEVVDDTKEGNSYLAFSTLILNNMRNSTIIFIYKKE